MNLLFTICARAGSKGVKNKNIRDFLGYPLSYYTIAAYNQFCAEFGSYYDGISLAVNTDSKELVEQIKLTNVEHTLIQRKEELAGDIVSKVVVIKDTVREMEALSGISFDVVIDLDLTSPLRTIADIKGTITALTDDKLADLSFSVTNARRLPPFNMVTLKEDGSYSLVIDSEHIARQQAPQYYDMNASIYAYKKSFIINRNTKTVFDGRATCYKMIDTAVLDIDDEESFELMEVIARHFFDNYPDFGLIEKIAKSLLY